MAWESGHTRARVGKYAGQESGTIKAGVGNHGTMLLVQHAKQDVKFSFFKYIPNVHKTCTLSPRAYVNPDALHPETLRRQTLNFNTGYDVTGPPPRAEVRPYRSSH